MDMVAAKVVEMAAAAAATFAPLTRQEGIAFSPKTTRRPYPHRLRTCSGSGPMPTVPRCRNSGAAWAPDTSRLMTARRGAVVSLHETRAAQCGGVFHATVEAAGRLFIAPIFADQQGTLAVVSNKEGADGVADDQIVGKMPIARIRRQAGQGRSKQAFRCSGTFCM
jgi:hypothetical protein